METTYHLLCLILAHFKSDLVTLEKTFQDAWCLPPLASAVIPSKMLKWMDRSVRSKDKELLLDKLRLGSEEIIWMSNQFLIKMESFSLNILMKYSIRVWSRISWLTY
mgnify:CR=1 FL=1